MSMSEKITINNLKIQEANESDWQNILDLLKEVQMDFWMDEGQDHRGFYRIEENGVLVCCFALLVDRSDAILRHFTVKKNLQGKGYGKRLANDLIPAYLLTQGVKMIYLLCDNKEPYISYNFWKKTRYKVLAENPDVPKFFKDYTDKDSREHPEYVDTRYAFCLNLISESYGN